MTKIAFLMDPIESIALKKDSTLAMIRAAQLRGSRFTTSARRFDDFRNTGMRL